MRGAKQRNITSGRNQKGKRHGGSLETGLVKRGPGRPRKHAFTFHLAREGSAVGENEAAGGVQEGHL